MISRAAIFCVLDSLNSSYSLTEVVLDQAKMFALAGTPVDILMLEDWKGEDCPIACQVQERFPLISFRPCVPRLVLIDYDPAQSLDEQAESWDSVPLFADKVAVLVEQLDPILSEYPVVLMHDLLFQRWDLPHGVAVRQIGARYPQIKWLHWQHSGPSPVPDPYPEWPYTSLYEPMSNCRFVYVNDTAQERALVADMRGIPEYELAYVPNTRDVLEYNEAPSEAAQVIRKLGLLDAELLFVVPSHLRDGKQPKKAIMTVRAFRACGVDARLVWVASATNPLIEQHRKELNDLRAFAQSIGLADDALHFTCELLPEWRDSCSRPVTRAFQQIADGLILPSWSEAHSLVAMEAVVNRQLLILNEDFPAMAEWFPRDTVYQMKYCSARMFTRYHSADDSEEGLEHELEYYRVKALEILFDLQRNRLWRLANDHRRHRNLQYVFQRYLEPALYG